MNQPHRRSSSRRKDASPSKMPFDAALVRLKETVLDVVNSR